MLDQEKLPLLVEAWLSYIRQEEMTLAEVEKGRGSFQKVFDTGVRLVGNKLILDSALFNQLQQQCLDALKRRKPHEFQIGVTGPQIYSTTGKGLEQKLKYLPLFVIDISKIFQGNYRKSGWDLTEFELQPVVFNLMRLYRLEEEEAESLIVTEGISKFLEDAFKRKFSSLGDFIDQVDLPFGNYKTARSAYLVRFDLVPYNTKLKQDLREILQQLEAPQNCPWLVAGTPTTEYLFGSPQPSPHEVMFWGAFPNHAPDEYQARVLKHVQQNNLTAILGPAGTGKTEAFLHLAALQVVKRALQLAHAGIDESNLMLFASTNNSAIQKYVERIARQLQGARLVLSGGNTGAIAGSTLPQLQQARDSLLSTPFNSHDYEQALQELLQAEDELQQLLEQDPINQQQQAEFTSQLEQLDVEIESLNDKIAAIRAIEQQLIEQLSTLPDYSKFPTDAYKQIQRHLDQTWIELPFTDDPFLKKAKNWLSGVSDQQIFDRLGDRTRTAVMNTLATDFPFQVPLNYEALVVARRIVATDLEAVESWDILNQQLEETRSQLNSKEQEIASSTTGREEVQQQLDSYPTEDFYSRFYRDYHSLQVQLFQRAWEFLQQEALRRKNEVLRALETYGSALSGEGDALLKLETDGQNVYRDLSLIFPVITSSLQSVRNMLPFLHNKCVDLALVDEAGTTLLHQLFPLLVRSRQAVVAGDPQQIEPIINLCDDTIKEYRKKAFLEQGLSDEDYYRYSPTAKYTATAYHRAAGASGSDFDLGTGIVLRNHYRCAAPIIQFCIPNYSGGLIIKTPSVASALGSNLIAYHVEGSHSNNTNPEEIEAVVAVIEHLLKHGYCIGNSDNSKTIGVMSPFWQQASALRYRLQSCCQNFHRNDIGTVHTFQGGEKSVIIFSPYQCHKEHSFWYLNRRPNLLNTAVSRAQELFIMVGNLRELEMAGGETKRLVEHIKQYGEIRELPSVTVGDAVTKNGKFPRRVKAITSSPGLPEIGQKPNT